MSNWLYLDRENANEQIQLEPLKCGCINLIAEDNDLKIKQNIKFKTAEFLSLIPQLSEAIKDMDTEDFDYYSPKRTYDRITSVCKKGWFQFVPVENDIICLQLYSDHTKYEISIILNIDDIKSLINVSNEIKNAHCFS